LNPEDIKILNLEAIWTVAKEQGCPDLILDNGTQKARLKT